MNPPTDWSQESVGQRMSAVNAMRDRANRLRKEAARWEALANVLDDGEGSPLIRVGSPAEELLWELASRPIEIGL
jgi:hypothetical protein